MPKKPHCICDSIYDSPHDTCEPSTGYLCRYLASDADPSYESYGKSITKHEAIETARKILANAEYPLIAGIESLGVRAQQISVDLARQAGGVIDSGGKSSGLFSLTREGMVSATIGEATAKSDLVLVIDCSPSDSHPRLLKKFGNTSKFLYYGTKTNQDTAITWQSEFLTDFELVEDTLVYLLLLLRGELPNSLKENLTEETRNALNSVAEKLQQASYVTVLCANQIENREFDSTLDTVTAIAKCLNAKTKCSVIGLRNDQNAISAENVLAWSTGFPASVDFSLGFARGNYDEYSRQRIAKRADFDALVCFQEFQQGALDLGAQDFWESLGSNAVRFPIIRFCWDQVSSGVAGPPLDSCQLVIRNLSVVPDDFTRLDDVQFSVEANFQTADPKPEKECLSQFLKRLLDATNQAIC